MSRVPKRLTAIEFQRKFIMLLYSNKYIFFGPGSVNLNNIFTITALFQESQGKDLFGTLESVVNFVPNAVISPARDAHVDLVQNVIFPRSLMKVMRSTGLYDRIRMYVSLVLFHALHTNESTTMTGVNFENTSNIILSEPLYYNTAKDINEIDDIHSNIFFSEVLYHYNKAKDVNTESIITIQNINIETLYYNRPTQIESFLFNSIATSSSILYYNPPKQINSGLSLGASFSGLLVRSDPIDINSIVNNQFNFTSSHIMMNIPFDISSIYITNIFINGTLKNIIPMALLSTMDNNVYMHSILRKNRGKNIETNLYSINNFIATIKTILPRPLRASLLNCASINANIQLIEPLRISGNLISNINIVTQLTVYQLRDLLIRLTTNVNFSGRLTMVPQILMSIIFTTNVNFSGRLTMVPQILMFASLLNIININSNLSIIATTNLRSIFENNADFNVGILHRTKELYISDYDDGTLISSVTTKTLDEFSYLRT